MLVTYMRSSSYNTWSFCQHQYMISYLLGLKPDDKNGWVTPKPQKKADKGSIVHKILELLASKKLAEQEGRATFTNDELGSQEFSTAKLTVDQAITAAWDHYTENSIFDWDHFDYRDVRKWTFDAMSFCDGLFSPLKRTVICPEKYFDLTLDMPWAKYRYPMPNGEVLEGQLAMKGTVDLTVAVDGHPDTLELVDWKSGLRKDWATGKEKDWKKLRKDPQMRMYHYALSRVFPQYKYFIVSIVFIQDGGPFSLDFGPQDLVDTENMLRERFDEIRACTRPARIINDPVHKWKCGRLCFAGMSEWEKTGETVCNHLYKEVVQLGMDRVVAKYGRSNAFSSYGDGGGRSAETTKVTN